jgi:hypothetical protein
MKNGSKVRVVESVHGRERSAHGHHTRRSDQSSHAALSSTLPGVAEYPTHGSTLVCHRRNSLTLYYCHHRNSLTNSLERGHLLSVPVSQLCKGLR